MTDYNIHVPETWQAVEAMKLSLWGFNIGPLNGKIPYKNFTPHGFKNFSDDTKQVLDWWQQVPTANIGARPWRWSLVLDVDVRSGGIDTWEQLNQGHTLPKTLVTETGSGGYHWWFKLPYRDKMNGTAGPGIDVKHNGGYLVMPGSIHPKTGEFYKCVSWVEPEDIPVLPKHLRRHVFKAAKPVRAIMPQRRQLPNDGGNLVRMVLEAPDGQRNETFNRAVFIAAKNEVPVLDELVDAARAAGLEETEIISTFNSAMNAGGKKVVS